MDDYLITKYLDDQLTPAELDSFNERLKADDVFRQEVETMQLVHRLLAEFSVQPAPAGLESRILSEVATKFNPLIRFVQWVLIVWATLTLVLLGLKFSGLVSFGDTVSGLDVHRIFQNMQQYQTFFSALLSLSFSFFFLYFSQSWIKKIAKRQTNH